MRKHEIDVVSLSFGWVFLAITAWWLVAVTVDVDLPSAGWFFASGMIVLGLLGLYAAVRPARSQIPPTS
jgi:hypothetical protein